MIGEQKADKVKIPKKDHKTERSFLNVTNAITKRVKTPRGFFQICFLTAMIKL